MTFNVLFLRPRVTISIWMSAILISLTGSLGTPIPENPNDSKEKPPDFPFTNNTSLVEPASSNTQASWTVSDSMARGYHYDSHESTEYHYPMPYFTTHSPHHSVSPLAIVTVMVFGFLALVLLLQLLGVRIARSLSSDPTSLPLEFWNMSSEIIPELMIRAADWMDSNWMIPGNGTEITRSKRSVPDESGPRIRDWLRAYRKDPYSYSCIRKLACDTLATSTLAERSVKSPLGGTLMSMLGRAMEHGSEVVDLINEVVGDPEKCIYFVSNELCN